MNLSLLTVLACPGCRSSLTCRPAAVDGEWVEQGELQCAACSRTYPVHHGVPRLVDGDPYASSFGFQWNLFRELQLDSYNGATLSRDRFFAETGLQPADLTGKWILDGGCGAGRFLDVLVDHDVHVVGLDLSLAVDAARRTVGRSPRADVVQASLLALPFRDGMFDICYSIGVMQHTPRPVDCVEGLARVVKPGGRIAVTAYERKLWTKLNAKYLIRPLTRRWDSGKLLAFIIEVMPFLYPVTRRLFNLPVVGRLFQFLIPVADCTRLPGLTDQDRYRFTILDTFDMLSPAYDSPLTESEVSGALTSGGIGSIRRSAYSGLSIVGTKLA